MSGIVTDLREPRFTREVEDKLAFLARKHRLPILAFRYRLAHFIQATGGPHVSIDERSRDRPA